SQLASPVQDLPSFFRRQRPDHTDERFFLKTEHHISYCILPYDCGGSALVLKAIRRTPFVASGIGGLQVKARGSERFAATSRLGDYTPSNRPCKTARSGCAWRRTVWKAVPES